MPFKDSQGTVSVLDANGKREAKTVSLGLRNNTTAEVLHGLSAGDKVVVPPVSAEDRRTIDIGEGN